MALLIRRVNFNKTSPLPQGYRLDFFYDIAVGTFSGEGTFLGSIFHGENIWYYGGPSPLPASFYDLTTYKRLKITSLGTTSFATGFFETIKLEKYDSLYLRFHDSSPVNNYEGTLFLPEIPFHTGTTIDLLFSVTPESYYNNSGALGDIAAGTLAKRTQSDSITLIDDGTNKHEKVFVDSIAVSEGFKYNPRQYPPEKIKVTDSMILTAKIHGTITDWNFAPHYQIMWDSTGVGGDYGTTDWDLRVIDFGVVRKSIKHWSGEYEAGNLELTLADESNDLYGSLYGSSTSFEARNTPILLRCLIDNKFPIYVSQFGGVITRTRWNDGKLFLESQDKLKDLPYRTFVYDYENISSLAPNGEIYGRVLKVHGTEVMFNDYGSLHWIPRKKEGKDFLESLFSGITSGIFGRVGGGWIGAGIGFVSGFLSNLPSGDKIIGGFYKVEDFNVIPDDLIQSGAKIKFHSGSFSGTAKNTLSPLFEIPDYVIKSGTLRSGIFGTISFDLTDGIKVGDYIYARKPLAFSGDPNFIIKSILTGSNIDYPYGKGGFLETIGPFGQIIYEVELPNDFSSDFDSELSGYELMKLGKILEPNDDTTPFNEIKQLAEEVQFSFFVDDENKFTVRSIKPKNLISPGNEATYTQNVNILDGFEYSRSLDDAITGVKMFYNFQGELPGGPKDGYGKFLEIKSKNPIKGVTQWGTIESKWIHETDDAKVVAWRTLTHREKAVDKINLPTTLYGVINSIADIIRVTHKTGSITKRLFEVTEFDKDFTNSKVNLGCVDAERTFGKGNCDWIGTSIPTSTATMSGFSVNGLLAGSLPTVATINTGTLLAFATRFPLSSWSGDEFWNFNGRYIVIGTNNNQNTEIILIKNAQAEADGNWVILERGLFNTIPRTYFSPVYIKDLAPAKYDLNTNELLPDSIGVGSYRFGTTFNIHTNIGTAYKFF